MADAQEPITIRRERLLFVEGQGEAIVFGAALRALSRAADIQIIPCGGKNRMRAVYDAYRLQLEFRSVRSYGVVRDADQNAVGAFQSIRAMLQAAGEPCPPNAGAFVNDPKRQVGVFILPNNVASGCLETLLIGTIGNAAFLAHVNQFITNLSNVVPTLAPGAAKAPATFYVPNHVDKAKALAVLAGTYEPALSIGRAAEDRYWDWTSPAIAPLMDFFRSI